MGGKRLQEQREGREREERRSSDEREREAQWMCDILMSEAAIEFRQEYKRNLTLNFQYR